MEGADVGRPVAEEGEADRSGAEILGGERRAGRERKVRADDRERAERADAHVGEVHRAALAMAEAVRLAEDLRHRAVQRSPHREHGTVAAVGASHGVARSEHAARTDGDRLLPLTEMRAAADEVLHEEAHHLVLEEPDLEHLPVQVDQQPAVLGIVLPVWDRH